MFEGPRLCSDEVTGAAPGHIISVIPALASLCLAWGYHILIDQGYGKHEW